MVKTNDVQYCLTLKLIVKFEVQNHGSVQSGEGGIHVFFIIKEGGRLPPTLRFLNNVKCYYKCYTKRKEREEH